jgi:hypothetical protein
MTTIIIQFNYSIVYLLPEQSKGELYRYQEQTNYTKQTQTQTERKWDVFHLDNNYSINVLTPNMMR